MSDSAQKRRLSDAETVVRCSTCGTAIEVNPRPIGNVVLCPACGTWTPTQTPGDN